MSHLPPAASYRRVPLLPCDAPALITDLNPACLCGHAQHVHEPDLSWMGARSTAAARSRSVPAAASGTSASGMTGRIEDGVRPV